MKLKISIIFLTLSILYSLPLTAQTIFFTAYSEQENIKIAVRDAQKILSKKIYEKTLSKHLFTAENFIFPHEMLTVRNLGRSKDGKKTKVMIRLTKKNYIEALQKLADQSNQKINNYNNWKSNSIEDITKNLNYLKAFLSLALDSSLIKIQESYRREHQKLISRLNNLTSKATLVFIGETEGAEIILNGIKQTRLQINDLLPGKHFFEVSKEGNIPIKGAFYLNPGERRQFFISLIKAYEKPLFAYLNLSPSLEPYKKEIIAILSDLGIKTKNKEQAKYTIDINLEHHTIIFGAEKKIDKKVYFVNSKLFKKINPNPIIQTIWRQVYNAESVSSESKNQEKNNDEADEKILKETIQKAIYRFRQAVDQINL
jgi:hypothetical protein